MTSTKGEHQGPGHGDVTLSLTSETKDGGQLHRSWVICECSARVLRGRLGPPQRETIATAEAVLNVPGAVMDWRIIHDGLAALGSGRIHVYLVSGDVSADGGEVTAVRLTRWSRPAAVTAATIALVAEEAARNVIVFPLGRGPGRPGGALEVAAHMDVARLFAGRFEAGESLAEYPQWQQPLEALADGDVQVLVEEIEVALRNQRP